MKANCNDIFENETSISEQTVCSSRPNKYYRNVRHRSRLWRSFPKHGPYQMWQKDDWTNSDFYGFPRDCDYTCKNMRWHYPDENALLCPLDSASLQKLYVKKSSRSRHSNVKFAKRIANKNIRRSHDEGLTRCRGLAHKLNNKFYANYVYD